MSGTFTLSRTRKEQLPRHWFKPWTWKRRYRHVTVTTAPMRYDATPQEIAYRIAEIASDVDPYEQYLCARVNAAETNEGARMRYAEAQRYRALAITGAARRSRSRASAWRGRRGVRRSGGGRRGRGRQMATVRWGWFLAIMMALVVVGFGAGGVVGLVLPPPSSYIIAAITGWLVGCGGMRATKPWWMGERGGGLMPIFGRRATMDDGYGRCGRCGWSWRHGDYHDTEYKATGSSRTGMFVLCEACWQRLSPAARLPYYRAAWEDHHRHPVPGSTHEESLGRADRLDEDWTLIEAAVLAGR